MRTTAIKTEIKLWDTCSFRGAIANSGVLSLSLTLIQGKKFKVCCRGGVMASDSEPGKFFSFDPQTANIP